MILATVVVFGFHDEFEENVGWLKEIAEREDTICNEKLEKNTEWFTWCLSDDQQKYP